VKILLVVATVALASTAALADPQDLRGSMPEEARINGSQDYEDSVAVVPHWGLAGMIIAGVGLLLLLRDVNRRKGDKSGRSAAR